ncbi:MAG: GGDEF domain-containing protein [Geobacter sp.]
MVPAHLRNNEDVVDLLSRRNAEMASLLEIGKTLTSSLELRDVLKGIMAQLERLLQPQIWSLLLKDEETGELTFEIAVSPVSNDLKGMRLQPGQGVAGWVAQQGEALLIPDVSKDTRFDNSVAIAVDYPVSSIACVPLKIRERVLGVLELIGVDGSEPFNPENMPLLGALADFAAIAIDNARNYQRISELVITDDLTGLYNARHFHELLEYEVVRAKRYGSQVSLLFLDLDHFKEVNDTYGHLVGSRVIAEVGHLIRRHIRSADRAARYGGDEYVIVLPNTGKQGALSAATKMLERLHEHSFQADSGEQITMTASFGVATYPDDAPNKTELIRAADTAMYDAKEGGRNGVCSFENDFIKKYEMPGK